MFFGLWLRNSSLCLYCDTSQISLWLFLVRTPATGCRAQPKARLISSRAPYLSCISKDPLSEEGHIHRFWGTSPLGQALWTPLQERGRVPALLVFCSGPVQLLISSVILCRGSKGQWQAGGPFLIVGVPNSPTFCPQACSWPLGSRIFSLGEESMSYFLILLIYSFNIHLFNTSSGHGTGMGVGGEGQGIIGPCWVDAGKVDKTQLCGRLQCSLSLLR